jgi:hypothetical protein
MKKLIETLRLLGFSLAKNSEFTYVMQLSASHDHYVECEVMGHQLRLRYVDYTRNYEGWGICSIDLMTKELLRLNTEAKAYEVRY